MTDRHADRQYLNRAGAELVRLLKAFPAALAIAHLVLPAPLVLANPGGAHVVHGQAVLQQHGSRLDVVNTPGAVIHWQNFSIGGGEITRFVQQGASSAVLNRVVGPHLSDIQGRLESNGKVFLINPNGIAVGADAVIDTNGFVASTLGMTDADFMSGRLAFAGDGNGAIQNDGLIVAHAGDVLLVAPRIENSGVIQAEDGSVLLAAGRSVLVADISYEGVAFELQAPDDAVLNLGELLAGGTVAAFAGTLTHTGVAQANSVHIGAGGEIILAASGDVTTGADSLVAAPGGAIRIESGIGSDAVATTWIGGAVDVSSTTGTGGVIDLLGPQVGLDAGARVSADGASGGGAVHVGGNYLGQGPLPNSRAIMTDPDSVVSASATASGDGGEVILWSDEVSNVHGAIAARGADGRGGFVETSSKGVLTVTGAVDIGADSGNGGQWLLDPAELTVTAPPGDATQTGAPPNTTFESSVPMSTVGIGQITGALGGAGGNTVTLRTTGPGGSGGDGVIDVNAVIDLQDTGGPTPNTLIFDAFGDVNLNANIQDRTAGGQTLNMTFQSGGVVNFNSGSFDTQGGVIDVQIANGGAGAAVIAAPTTISSAAFMANSLAVNADVMFNGGLVTLTDTTSLAVAASTNATFNAGVNLSNNVTIGDAGEIRVFGGNSTLQDGTNITGNTFFFSVDPATLTIPDGATVNVEDFRMSAGDLFQNGTLNINTAFNFQGGDIIGDSVADQTVITSGAELIMDGLAGKVISNHTLVHQSTTTTSSWSQASLFLNNSAVFRNEGFLAISSNGNQVGTTAGVPGTFDNTAGANADFTTLPPGGTFDFNVPFSNDGLFDGFDADINFNFGGTASGGTFRHANSSAPGTGFNNIGAAQTLAISNATTFVGDGSNVTSAFTNGNSAILDVAAGPSAFIELLALNSGSVIVQDGAFLDLQDTTWSGGNIVGATSTAQINTLPTGTFTVVTSATARILDTARLIIQAGATGDLQASFGVLSGGSFENSGTTNAIDNVSIGSGGAVLNDGTFNFNGSGGGPLTIQSALTNNGTFNDATGVTGPGVLLTGGGTNNGTIDISSFGSVTITNNPFNLAVGSVIQNTGPLILNAASSQLTLLSGGTSDVNNVIFSDGLIDGPGQTRIQGNLNWSGGTVATPAGIFVNSTGTISNTVAIDAGNVTVFGTLNWTGGDILLNNAGELTVSGIFNMNAAGQSITGDANPSSRVRNFVPGGQINVNSPNVTLDAVLLNESGATLSSNSSNFRITRPGTAAGTFSAFGTGAEIDFDFAGNFALNGATFNTDTDPMELLNGTFDVGGAAVTTVTGSAGLSLIGGDINVQAGAELNATSNGRISVLAPTSFTGPGITRIASDGILTISDDITLNNHNIIAGGTMAGNFWNAGNITATNDATFTVPVGGDFAIISSTGLLFDYGNAGGVGGFNIDGRITTGGSTGGVITIDVPVNVTGTLDLDGSANMALTRGGVSVMPTINTTAGELLFNGGTHQFSGPLPGGIFGANFARVQSGTLQTLTSGFGVDRLAIEGGTVQADIGLTAVNDLVWTGGTITGGDAVTAANGAVVNISGGAKAINNGELVIDTPTAAWSAGNIVATNDGFLTINALARLDLSGTILLDYGNAGATGGVNVSGDLFSMASSATIDIPVNVTNGLVTADSGVLNMTRGGTGSTASYSTGVGPATLQFGGGTHDLAGVTTFLAPMGEFVEISAGSVITQGNSSADTLRLSGGALDTRMDLDVNTFEWTGGTITGGVAGRTNVQSSVLISGGAKSLNNGRFRMAGAVGTWDAGNITATNDGFFDVNGDLTVTADVVLDYGNAGGTGGMSVEESGVVIGDTPNFVIDIPVNLLSGDGDGEIRVNSGRTSLTRGSFGTGSRGTYAANGGDLAFDGGTHVLQAFTQITSTTGDVIVDSGTVNTQTGMISADRLVIDGGTLLQDAGSMIDVTGDLIFRGGSLSGGGMATAELLVSGNTTLTTATTKNLSGGNLVIGGAGLWDAGTVNVTNDGFLRVATLGTLAVNGDVTLDYGNAGGVGGFEMLGTLNVTTSPTSFVVDVPLFNNGAINVNAGTMLATRGGDSSGTFNTPTGRFEFAGGSHAIRMGASFTGGGALTERSAVTGGNADVQVAAAVTAEFFEVSGGTFNVEGSFDSLNSLRWLGGTIGGAGTATVLSGNFTIDSATTKTLSTVSLDVLPVALNEMLGSGTVNLNNGSTLRVSGSLALNGSGAIDYGSVGAVGTLDIPSGGLLTRNVPGEVLIDSNFSNDGNVQVDDGTMRFTRAGTLGGSFIINTPGLVRVTGGTYNLPGASIAGTGFFAIEGGTVNLDIATTSTVDNFRVAGGTLQGDGNLDILTRGEWQGGTIRGAGIVRNTSASVFELSGAASKTLNDTSTLANDGSLVHLGTANLGTNGAASITNSGTWDVQSDVGIDTFSGVTPFSNTGVLTKSAGAGNSLLDVDLTSTGTFSITSGTFQLSTASDLSGTMNASGSGAFRYTGGTHSLQDLSAFTGNALLLEGGIVNLLGTTTIDNTVQSGGTVTNAGTLVVVNNFDWQSGSQGGAGNTTVNAGATLNLLSAASKSLTDSRTLANNGTVVHTGTANLGTNGAASITNSGAWDVQSNVGIDTFSGITPFNNTGVLTKSAGAGNSLLDVDLTSTGTFSITSGTFQLSTASDLSGTMNASGSGAFRYTGGTHTLQDLSAFTGNALLLEGGIVNLLGTTSIDNAVQSGGTVTNAGTLVVVNNFDWQSGSQGGAGNTTVNAGATLNLLGAASKSLTDSRTLANNGTVVHTGTANLGTNGAASITNSGTWDVQSDVGIDTFSGVTPFSNTGVLTKSAGAGNSLLDVDLTSTGTFSITSGTFQLSTASDLSGTMNATGSGAFRYTGGTHSLQDLSAFTGNALLLEGGIVNLLGTTSIDNAVQSGGTVTNAGTLVVVNNFDWQSGSQGGTGTTTVNAGATLNLLGAASKSLTDSRTLANNGTVVHTGTANLGTNGAASITNSGTWDVQSNVGIDTFSGITPFNNTGVLTKSAGIGNSLLDVDLTSTGTFSITSGTFQLSTASDLSGTMNATGGAFEYIGGTHTLQDLTAFTGDALLLEAGTVNLLGTTSIDNAIQSGSLVTNAGTLVVVNNFDWQSGSQGGSGSTIVNAGATLNLLGAGSKFLLDSRTLTNNGTLVQTGTANLGANGLVSITNTGSWDLQSDAGIDSFSGAAAFGNTGTFTKSGGTGTSLFDVALANNGTLAATTGTLNLVIGGTHTGTFDNNGGSIAFSGGAHNLADGSVLSGAVPFAVTGSALNLTGITTGATVAAAATLPLDNQTLGGTGILNVAGTLQMARNTTVPGTVQVAAGGLLDGRANGSDGTFQIGTLTSDGTVRLQNVGVAANNLSLTILDGTPITNRGLFEVSGMGGARTITGAAVDIDGGTLDLQTGTTVNVSAGQSRIRNAGTLSSSGADSTFDATGSSLGLALEDTSTLFIDTGRIFTVDGDFSFIGGTLGGAGELQVVNGNFSVPGAATRSIAGQTVNINDTTLSGGGTLALDGGTLNLTGTTTIDPGTTLALNAGSAFLGGPLNNNGRFEVNAGTFTINVGGTSSGEFAVSGATLVFDTAMAGPGNTLTNGATLSGGGTVSVTGNGLDVTALTTPVDLVAGTQLQLNGATINGGGAINATGNVAVLANSTLNATINVLSNTLTVNSGTTLTVDVLSNTAAGAVEIPVAAGIATINALTAFNNDGMLNIAGATAINGAFTNGATGSINQSGAGDLTFDLGGGALQHLGAWQAMGTTALINNTSMFTIGGNLNLDGATLTQNGGATNWTGTTALMLTGSGVVDLAGTGLTIDALGSKQVTGGTLMSNTTTLASGANLQVGSGAIFTGTSLNVTSGATADVTDASVTVANTSVNGTLRGLGTSTFGNLGIGSSGAFEVTSSATSAIATAGTITNAGNVRLGFSRSGGADPQLTFTSLVNSGTVTATDSGVGGSRNLNGAVTNNAGGTLTSSAGAVLAINGNLANAGTVRADTANVQVTGTTFSNSASAVLTSLAGGQINHTGNLAIDGSTVNATLNAAAIDVTGAATINGALNTTALSIAGGANVTLTQGGTAAGAITVGSGSSLTFGSTPFILNDGATLTGGGTFNLGTAQVAGATTGVTINSGTTAALAGTLAGSGLLTVNGTLAASGASSFGGSVVVGSGGSLNAVSGGALSLGALDNRGLVRLGNTGSTPAAAALSFANLANSGELRIEAGLGGMRTVTGGFANTGLIRVVNSRVDFNTGGAAASNSGTIAVEGANGFVAINGAPTFTGTGNISLAAGAHLGLTSGQYVWSGGSITGAASSEFVIGDTLRATGTGTRALSAPLIAASVIVDPGTTLATGASAVNATNVNVNGGTLTTGGSFGAINVLGINNGGLVTLTNATVTTAMLDVASGTLAGTGTVNGNVLNQSIVSVGNSPGILTVAGNYTQTASGTLVLEIGGTAPFEAGIDFDQLRVQGAASLGGTLRIVEIPGGQSLAGQNISPITFASASGAFARTEVVGSPTFSFTGTIGPNGFGVTADESIGKAVQDALGKDKDPSKNRIETSQQLAELSDEQQDLEGCNKDDADDPAALSEGEHGVGCR